MTLSRYHSPQLAPKSLQNTRRRHTNHLVQTLAIGLLTTSALAAHPPQPSATPELLHQQARERQLREQLERQPDVHLESPTFAADAPLAVDETPCLPIARIELGGPDAADFTWILAALDRPDDPPTGRCLGARGINQLMTRLQNRLIERGYITTRVVAAPQDLNSGLLTLTVIPGRLRQLRMADGSPLPNAVRAALPGAEGNLLDLRAIEQALENLKRPPGADADIQLVPADGPDAAPGESDLSIAWHPGPLARTYVSIDDSGTKATGRLLGSLTQSLDNLLTLNDLFYVSLNHDLGGGPAGNRGTRGYTAHYSLPYGYWLLGITASGNRYHQAVAGLTQTYRYGGDSENGEVRLTRLLHRDASTKTSAHLKAWVRQSSNTIDDTEIVVQRRRMGGWEAGIAHRAFIGTATLDADLAHRRSTGAFGELTPPERLFGDADGRAGIWLASTQLNLPFPLGDQRLRYQASARLQRSDGPLVPQDRFAIGGRYSVRGFDGETLLTGDRGWLWRNDLALALRDTGAELYVGADVGVVSGRSTTALVGRRLAGGALGVRGSTGHLNYDVFAGLPLSRPTSFQTPSALMGFAIGLAW